MDKWVLYMHTPLGILFVRGVSTTEGEDIEPNGLIYCNYVDDAEIMTIANASHWALKFGLNIGNYAGFIRDYSREGKDA